MDEIKRPTQVRDLGVTSQKIETAKYLYFKGLDGKDYSDPQVMQRANQEWMRQNNKYISPWTGKEYVDYEVMQRDERAYWEQQIKPEDKIINKEKIEVKKF